MGLWGSSDPPIWYPPKRARKGQLGEEQGTPLPGTLRRGARQEHQPKAANLPPLTAGDCRGDPPLGWRRHWLMHGDTLLGGHNNCSGWLDLPRFWVSVTPLWWEGYCLPKCFSFRKWFTNLPGFEPGIFWSVVRRVIHCATGPTIFGANFEYRHKAKIVCRYL